jgi:dienelactone hydrolase
VKRTHIVLAAAALEEGRFMAVPDSLEKQKNINPERIAAIGYCFGGGVMLRIAPQDVNLTLQGLYFSLIKLT